MDNEIKVYRMNDYEWWASKWGKKATNEYYKKTMGVSEEDNPVEQVLQCDLDMDGMWYTTEDEQDITKLGEHDEIINPCRVQFGDLKRMDGEVYKYIPLREAVMKDINFKEPYCLASTEW